MRERLINFWADLLGLVPEILLFLLILVVGFVLAILLQKGTDALLGRLRVNRLFQRNVERATSRRLGWNVVGILSQVVYWLVVLFTFYFAFGVFGDTNPFFLLFAAIVAFLPKVVVAILLVVVAGAVGGIVRRLITEALSGISYGRVLGNIAGVSILVFGVLAALAQVGVAIAILIPLYTAFLVTLAGILIVGVGGSLAVELRPYTARALENLSDELSTVADEVSTDPTPVAVEPTEAPVVATPEFQASKPVVVAPRLRRKPEAK